ncbi:bifunctional folylpolyglutamate synthase/dihydrofolate synthase [Thermoflavimicrobium daqui]|jgi:dihydrofolate synthase/folylpolyglutamate synthase|uniref:Dihydrofolate synthase/folylpolyglutamate synthase n=1 Tax=Thermoflavimicrobium daqui TaxID=2137476 RepID=A0A364K8P3_9BACL|nr:folylpolyglutamate synthase/dihydrofolate synthase family protein [Thermoflavimicrobium daqui]RAL26663.1 bifunctional folylpolyglutamate synthase/dihydrofolate synthase [Thermoflavimicrobium daqui]
MSQSPIFVQAEDVLHWMNETCAAKIQPGLERMEWMLEKLNHPERRCKFIHIAGTNGKGSTAAMISSVLREAGYKTGLFISPYVIRWNERIQVDGKPISDDSFVKWANYLYPFIQEMIDEGPGAPSPFEYWTLVALCYFAYEEAPWFIVWETGLGGKWDATNIVIPLVSVFTQIGLDHREFLGDTITDIAREKAGIIKSGVPVVSGTICRDAAQVIKSVAEEKNCRLYEVNKDFSITLLEQTADFQIFRFTNIYQNLPSLKIPLKGSHQLQNAATAIMTLEVLRQNYATVLEEMHYERGLSQVVWPGRLEKVGENPFILLDGAHNPDGMKALAKAIQELNTYDRCIAMIAMMRDKQIEEILQPLIPLVDQFVITEVANVPRSMSAHELAEQVKAIAPEKEVNVFASASEGLTFMKQHALDHDLLLITGSLYLVSEVRSLLTKE